MLFHQTFDKQTAVCAFSCLPTTEIDIHNMLVVNNTSCGMLRYSDSSHATAGVLG